MKTKLLFIIFSLLTIHYSLFAKEALPVLVEGGESFEDRDEFYIDKLSPIGAVAVSSDEKYIVSGSEDGYIKFWNLKTKKNQYIFKAHDEGITSLDISQNGKYLVSSSFYDNAIKLWDIKSKKKLFDFRGHKGGINQVLISGSGKYLVSASWDSTVKLWDLRNKKELYTFKGNESQVSSVYISKDEKYIVAALSELNDLNSSVIVWDIDTKKKVCEFSGYHSLIKTVQIDNDNVIFGDFNGLIRAVNINSKKPFYKG